MFVTSWWTYCIKTFLIFSYLEKYEVKYADIKTITAWKVSKYGVFFGPYIPLFSPNTAKYKTEKAPYFDIFHGVHAP